MGKLVVITGLGAVTPIGIGIPQFWKTALEGRSGVRRLKGFDGFDLSTYPSRVAAEVLDFDPLHYLVPKKA